MYVTCPVLWSGIWYSGPRVSPLKTNVSGDELSIKHVLIHLYHHTFCFLGSFLSNSWEMRPSSSHAFGNRKFCLWSEFSPFSRFPTLPFSLALTRGYCPHFSSLSLPQPSSLCLPTRCLSSPPPYRSPALCSVPCSSEGACPFFLHLAGKRIQRQHRPVSAFRTREVGQGCGQKS